MLRFPHEMLKKQLVHLLWTSAKGQVTSLGLGHSPHVRFYCAAPATGHTSQRPRHSISRILSSKPAGITTDYRFESSSHDTVSFDRRAAFTVASRLVAALITEGLLKAIFLPIKSPGAVGACVVLSSEASNAGFPLARRYCPADIFTIVPLRTLPILTTAGSSHLGRSIALVDPLDMLPWMYEICDTPQSNPASKVRRVSPCCAISYEDMDFTCSPNFRWQFFQVCCSCHTMISTSTQHSLPLLILYTYGENFPKSSNSTPRGGRPYSRSLEAPCFGRVSVKDGNCQFRSASLPF